MPAPSEPTIALVSLLHEHGDGSAARLVGRTPVLARTLTRLTLCETIDAIAVLCWEDQTAAAQVAADGLADVVPVGPRTADRAVELVRRGQAWADGWRGGPMNTTPPDRGWHAAAAQLVAEATGAAFVYAVDASFAFVDPNLTDDLVRHARENSGKNEPIFFTPAPPGLVGHVVPRKAVDALAAESDARRRHPGRFLGYLPDAPRLDPMGSIACRSGPPWLTHAIADLRVDDADRAAWAATVADDVDVRELIASRPPQRRDVTIDLTTRRRTRPIWLADVEPRDLTLSQLAHSWHWSGAARPVSAVEPDTGLAAPDQCHERDALLGARVTFAGVGDPLLHPDFADAVKLVRERGATAVHVETDLLDAADPAALVAAGVDVVSVGLPAMTAATYATVMRFNGMAAALANLARLVASPLNCVVVPTFTKLAANVGEMEAWYDQWLRAASAAVIRGPDAFNPHPAPDVAALAAAPLNRTDRQPVGRVLSPLRQAA